MNINDMEAPVHMPETLAGVIEAIFTKQRELMDKYKEIEQLPSPPLSLHTAASQRILKDFAWRTVEELTESFEAFEKHEDEETQRSHGLEELADAVHFFVELAIFAGLTAEQCVNAYETTATDGMDFDTQGAYWKITYKLGLAMNFLRNKAWKQSQVPTDELRFRQALLVAFVALIEAWENLGCSLADLYNYYMRKHAVNKFRQRSKY